MYMKLKHREEGCTTSLTGCVGQKLVLRLHIVQSHGMSGHVVLGAGVMCIVRGGYQIDPHSDNGAALGCDSARSADDGGSEDDTV
jgi:hypothetical protein